MSRSLSRSLALNKFLAREKPSFASWFVVAAGVIKSCPFKIKSGPRFVNASGDRGRGSFSSPEARLPSAPWNFGFALSRQYAQNGKLSTRKQQQQHFYVTNDGKLCARHAPTPLSHTMVQVGPMTLVRKFDLRYDWHHF
jgi:hypothetical protein